MSFNPRQSIPIPQHWTGEQAEAVFLFLEQISSAVFALYENAILETYERKAFLNQTDSSDDDCLPFEKHLPF